MPLTLNVKTNKQTNKQTNKWNNYNKQPNCSIYDKLWGNKREGGEGGGGGCSTKSMWAIKLHHLLMTLFQTTDRNLAVKQQHHLLLGFCFSTRGSDTVGPYKNVNYINKVVQILLGSHYIHIVCIPHRFVGMWVLVNLTTYHFLAVWLNPW